LIRKRTSPGVQRRSHHQGEGSDRAHLAPIRTLSASAASRQRSSSKLSAHCPPALRPGPTAKKVGTNGGRMDLFFFFFCSPSDAAMRGTRLTYETIARLQPSIAWAARGASCFASWKKQYSGDYPPRPNGLSTSSLPRLLSATFRQTLSALLRGRLVPADQLRQRRQASCFARASARGREIAVSPGLGAAEGGLFVSLSRRVGTLRARRQSPVSRAILRPGKFYCNWFREPAAPQRISISGVCGRVPSLVLSQAGNHLRALPPGITSRLNLTARRPEGVATNGAGSVRACDSSGDW